MKIPSFPHPNLIPTNSITSTQSQPPQALSFLEPAVVLVDCTAVIRPLSTNLTTPILPSLLYVKSQHLTHVTSHPRIMMTLIFPLIFPPLQPIKHPQLPYATSQPKTMMTRIFPFTSHLPSTPPNSLPNQFPHIQTHQ